LVSREGAVTVTGVDPSVGPVVSSIDGSGRVEPWPLAHLGELVNIGGGGQAWAVPAEVPAGPGPAAVPEAEVRVRRVRDRAAEEEAYQQGRAQGATAARAEGLVLELRRGLALVGAGIPPDASKAELAGQAAGSGCMGAVLGLSLVGAWLSGVQGGGTVLGAWGALWAVWAGCNVWAAAVRGRARLSYWCPVADDSKEGLRRYRFRVGPSGVVQVWAQKGDRRSWRPAEEFCVIEAGARARVRAVPAGSGARAGAGR
jgi:hypothetical protein